MNIETINNTIINDIVQKYAHLFQQTLNTGVTSIKSLIYWNYQKFKRLLLENKWRSSNN